MDICNNESIVLLKTVKIFISVVQFAIPIFLIVMCGFDVFRIIVFKEKSDIKKYQKYLFNRIIGWIFLIIVPTVIFLFFELLERDNKIIDNSVRECWNMAK